jgi:outer membrane receptor for ferrienterochelin and colicins
MQNRIYYFKSIFFITIFLFTSNINASGTNVSSILQKEGGDSSRAGFLEKKLPDNSENMTSEMSFTGHIYGQVTHKGKPVPYANISIKGASVGAVSDQNGHYLIDYVPPGKQVVVVSVMGYQTKETDVMVSSSQPIIMNFSIEESAINLDQVVVTGTLREVSLKDSPVKMDVISGTYLQRIASNNIIEAIELINGLDVCNDCSVCGTTGIHINGMESMNTAVLIDGMPIMGALASVYGLNGIPNEMIERIEVLKGPASTLYGSEAVAGVINIITKSPQKSPLLSFNSFFTSDAETNVDFAIAPLQKGKVSTMFSGNYFALDNFLDNNNDGFADAVLTKPRISVFNKWNIQRPDNRVFNVAAKYYHENRYGGTRDFLGHYTWRRDDGFRGNDSIYGESVFTDRFELIGSYQLPVSAENIKLDFSYSHHDQDSYYANDKYAARQEIAFTNMIWTKDINPRNEFLMGLSARYQTYDDNTEIVPEKDVQFIPGIFAQNQYSVNQNFRILVGARLDNHRNHGTIFSPRLNLSWKATPFTTFRFNSGTGFRIVNVFSEDHASYHGIRQVVIENEIKPERSVNGTISMNHVFNLGGGIFVWDVDVFYTHFTNKIEADYDSDPTKLIYKNLGEEEYAVSRGFATSLQATLNIPLQLSLGTTFQDVHAMAEDEDGFMEKSRKIKVPRWTAVYSASYDLRKIKTTLDFTGSFTGSMRMPQFDSPFERPELSESFYVNNLQITHKLNHTSSIYLGVRNIFDYTQTSPIINPMNPFDDTFDTSYVYGPLRGRRFIFGVRMFVN